MAAFSFWQQADRQPEKVALVDPDGECRSFMDIQLECNRISNGLSRLGLGRGDAVAVVLDNTHHMLEVYLACLQSGLYFTPINFHLTASEMGYILQDCEAKAFFATEVFAVTAREAASASPRLGPERCLAVGRIDGFRSLAQWTQEQSDAAPRARSPGMRMLYTSGTTGRPKGVRRPLPEGTADSVAAEGAQRFTELYGLGADSGVHLITGPLYHAAPLMFAVQTLHLGQTVVLMGKWDAEETLRLIDRYQVTSTHMVPTMFHRMLRLSPDVRAKYQLRSLRKVLHAAAPCPIEVKREMLEWLGPIVDEYYAASEGGSTYVSAEEWLQRPGTVGRPSPGSQVLIIDDDGRTLPTGVAGTIYFRLREPFEYFKDPEKTEQNRIGEYFTVGDIGYLDDDGYLFLCDRKSDMIISGGVNIYPAEIEAVLLGHPMVEDAAVIGVPSEEWGEEVKAVVQLVTGCNPEPETEGELLDFCRERLAHYKCPRSVDFRETLPRYESGKLYKRRIREEYWNQAGRQI